MSNEDKENYRQLREIQTQTSLFHSKAIANVNEKHKGVSFRLAHIELKQEKIKLILEVFSLKHYHSLMCVLLVTYQKYE